MVKVVHVDVNTGDPVYGFTRRGLGVLALPLGGIIVALAFGLSGYLGQRHDARVNCRSARQAAKIDAATLKRMHERSEQLLPRVSINGLTHQQLVEATQKSSDEETKRIAQLEILADTDCKNL